MDKQLLQVGEHSPPKQSILSQTLYAIGFISYGLPNTLLTYFLMAFLLEVAQIPAIWIAVIFAFRPLIHMVVNPMLINFDNAINWSGFTKKLMIVFFLVIAVIVWMLMWTSPGWFYTNSPLFKIGYYFSAVIIFSVFHNCAFLLYQSFKYANRPTGETAGAQVTLKQRIFNFLMKIFPILGSSILVYVWSEMLVIFSVDEYDASQSGMTYNYRLGYFLSATVTSLPIFVAMFIGCIFISNARDETIQQALDEGKTILSRFWVKTANSVKALFQISLFLPFTVILVVHSLSIFAFSFFSCNIILYIKYFLHEEAETPFYLGVIQLTLICSIVLWIVASKFIGKIGSYSIGLCANIAAALWLWFIDSTSPYWQVYCLFALLGIGGGSELLITNILLPDAINFQNFAYKQQKTDSNFLSHFIIWVDIFAVSLAQVISCVVFDSYDYSDPLEQGHNNRIGQNEDILDCLRIFVSLVPLVLRILVVPFIVVYFIIIKRHPHIVSSTIL